jgi:hypothetical protein
MWLDQDKGSSKEKAENLQKRAPFASERTVYVSGDNCKEEQAFDDAR